jgi:hydrogenase maturation protein HypF
MAPAAAGERARLVLECRGVVQGVGFRPAVHRLASRLGLAGTLSNEAAGVRLELQGRQADLERFLGTLAESLPPAARLEPLEPRWLPAEAEAPSPGGALGPQDTPPSLTITAGPAAEARPLGIGLVARCLAADRAPCPACRRELDAPRSRRHGDPFLSCTACGPRFAIATAEPWQRAHTTLAAFTPCGACAAEFADPTDRRFHAETISCPDCGPRLALLVVPEPPRPDGRQRDDQQRNNRATQARQGSAVETPHGTQPTASDVPGGSARAAAPGGLQSLGSPPAAGHSARAHHAALIAAAAELLAEGRILALQGVGGFQLLVDASNPRAVARLRRRKRRPARPFALLVADPAWIEPHVQLAAEARAVLASAAAPIVLLPRRHRRTGDGEGRIDRHGDTEAEATSDAETRAADPFPGVAPGSAQLGVMLPASPLHLLLVRRFGAPLVCTSGNPSGEPLCTEPAEALDRLAGIADAFLIHDRPIARPLDDSLLQLIDGRPALLRRARGYAPEPVALPGVAHREAMVLALGGDLKCAPALAAGGTVWLAPHLGDLAQERHHSRLRQGIDDLRRRHGEQLERIALDRHPGYLSHQLALALPLPRLAVQHHSAHALAVVAEHGLATPLLAFCADGLGHGEGQPSLWGGELLWIGPQRIQRLACLRPLPLPGGERAAREPRRVALGLLAAAGAEALAHPGAARTRAAFKPQEWALLEAMVAQGVNTPWTSSLGRLFDGVASLLGLCQRASYEGEAGVRLQGVAAQEALAEPAGRCATAAPNREESAAFAYPLPLRAAEPGPGADLPLGWLDWQPLLAALLADRMAGAAPGPCAARFHRGLALGLADLLAAAAGETGCHRVVLAGGCFQNALLLEASIAALRRRGLEPHWAEAVPGNDGGLALGQVMACHRDQEARLASRRDRPHA